MQFRGLMATPGISQKVYLDGRRYLCGDAFTAADLAFAALAAPVIVPPEYGTPLPAPAELPAEMAAGVRAFRAHPAGAFASRLFREER